MNPPSVLYGAMNKERKPFTYTPGGLDLSEIKSERMAKRLIRNAMDQGVPEKQISNSQPSTPPTTFNVPNFNCLPVQVFPNFTLPANPKSLLKTRSNSINKDKDEISYLEELTKNGKQIGSKELIEDNNRTILYSIDSSFGSFISDRHLSTHENDTTPMFQTYSTANYGSSGYTEPVLPKINSNTEKHIKPQADEDVKITKETTNGNAIEQQNGDTSVDENVEAAITVTLPTKKSAAKTETKVEVVKKILPDGSVEEVKTTTTKTTIDGKTEISTKTETTVIPKDNGEEEEEVVEEEEEEDEEVVASSDKDDDGALKEEKVEKSENLDEKIEEESLKEEKQYKCEPNNNIKIQEEMSNSITVTKNVTVIQASKAEDSEEEIEEEYEEDEEEVNNTEEISTKTETTENVQEDVDVVEVMSETNNEYEDKEEIAKNDKEILQEQQNNVKSNEDHEYVEDKEEINENKENENIQLAEKEIPSKIEEKTENYEENDEIVEIQTNSESRTNNETFTENLEEKCSQTVQENKEEIVIEVQVLKPNLPTNEEKITAQSPVIKENTDTPSLQTETKIPLREPSVPLEKVEDVEIKPIGQIISKSHTENTENTSFDKSITGLSTQTEYNRIENIVTVNRTTKTLDQAYEQIAQRGVPTVKTYYAPNMERLTTSPQPVRPYQPVYPPESQTERRHSLLLDRLSVDRQLPPTELYQSDFHCDNPTFDKNQWSQEPQSEVLTVSNVKPSSITKNQQWYQQTKKEEITYDHSSLNTPTQQWISQQSQIQPQLPSQPPVQSQYQPQSHFQSSYIDTQNTVRTNSDCSSSYQQNVYPSYTPKPTSWVNNVNSTKAVPTVAKGNNYLYTDKVSSDNYQKPLQHFSSSYVPPPWEQDAKFVSDNINQTYNPPQTSIKFTNSDNQTWTSSANSKFTKPKPTSYIPPAPNQSFVKPINSVEPPKQPGRKTYYSEYERRFISVPESTYIPNENKFQAQPDPSPQYYYDNNEPAETVEHEWRKELREFSEKTQTQSLSEQTLVKPPWEEDPKYYVPKVITEYTPTPTWSQTLRPRSWREKSFESEFVRSKDTPKTNTLGRGRPQSSYVKSNVTTPIPERTRGVSVDRYNPNNYKSPATSEYGPVQSHTLEPVIGAKTHHNPNVPAYHSRASVEPREQTPIYPQSRQWGEARASPIQSRSFKYLQWITGTED